MTNTPTPPTDEALLSPFMAAEHGLNDEQLLAFFERFNRKSQPVREFITSMDTHAAVKNAVASGVVPPEYAVAVAKLITYIAFDEVQSAQLPQIFEKLGMSATQAENIAQAIKAIMQPLNAKLAGAQPTSKVPIVALRPIQPLTQRISAPTPPPPSGLRPPERNILDLRNKPRT